MREINPNYIYTVVEAAELLQVSPSTLMRWIKSEKIVVEPIGRVYRILGATLIAALGG